MPATVTIDRDLLAEALRASGLASERATVELALRLLAGDHSQYLLTSCSSFMI
ncbi:type II toxin-antitoxin system VapB family antitoxin [Marinimicrococcus flavescens]|uniref:Type II toxin-antitoxin system VapB family antitoxin n=1 Tax=Marinimicrococcus flavescens TaxID=3031815 RepID=A0AAP3XS37_9PROT|nr:type II toxin-antitoxin system VapB family antitoxin [Marinimicrococcus flavescens]